MGKIIVPVDYSKASSNAYNFAQKLAKDFEASMHLVNVYKLNANTSESPASMSMYMKAAEKEFYKYIASKIQDGNKLIKGEFRIGFPGDEILSYSEDVENASIVMGTNGEKDFIRNIFGSISTKVGMNSKIPVWIIPPDSKYKQFKKIAFCTNDPFGDLDISYILSQMADKYDSEVHFINVFEYSNIDEEKITNKWSSTLPKKKLKFKTLYELDVVDALYEYCEENDIDLIVINRKHRTFLSMLFNKSVTKKMIIKSDIPLLITHSNSK